MTEYWTFFRRERSLLGYGLALTFFSSFGQTFLISLFVPLFLRDFSLSHAEFGTLYSGATLGSALLLPWVGRWLDHARLSRFTVAVVLLMAISAFLMAVAQGLALFCLALVGIRLAGQGLSAQTAVTAMARYYQAARGKAVSISGMGFPLGEAVLPLVVATSIAALGWRGSWVAVGVLALVLFVPLLLGLLGRSGVELDPRKVAASAAPVPVGEGRCAGGERRGPAAPARGPGDAARAPGDATRSPGNPARGPGDPPAEEPRSDWSRREVLRDGRFWLLLPAALLPPFWATGLFLYQTSIGELRGWSVSLMASAFVAFALARVVFSLAAGGAVDRLSARQVFPFSLLPLGAGLVVLLLFGGAWVPFAFMASLGITMGVGATAKSALWAELYGVRHLGSIKSMMAALMVVSTAGSPVLVGFVVGRAGGLEGLLMGGVASILVGTLLALRVLPASASAVAARA